MKTQERAEKIAGVFACQSNKTRILLGLWALFILWTGWETLNNGWIAIQTPNPNDQFTAYDLSLFFFWLNFWALLPALFFGLIVANPYRWLNGKRLVFSCIAFAMMLGRLASGGLGGLLFSYVNVGGGSMFLLMPFALALAGLTMIVGIGTIIVFLFGVFVAIRPPLSARYLHSNTHWRFTAISHAALPATSIGSFFGFAMNVWTGGGVRNPAHKRVPGCRPDAQPL